MLFYKYAYDLSIDDKLDDLLENTTYSPEEAIAAGINKPDPHLPTNNSKKVSDVLPVFMEYLKAKQNQDNPGLMQSMAIPAGALGGLGAAAIGGSSLGASLAVGGTFNVLGKLFKKPELIQSLGTMVKDVPKHLAIGGGVGLGIGALAGLAGRIGRNKEVAEANSVLNSGDVESKAKALLIKKILEAHGG